MALTRVERERVNDSVLKIQSAHASLDQIDENKIPNLEDVQDCLESADKTLRNALKNPPSSTGG